MPKRHSKNRRGGSWYDPSSWSNNNSSYTSNNSNNSWNPFASVNVDTSSWNPFASKKPTYSSYQSQPSYVQPPSYTQPPSSGYGGKKRHTKKRGGGFTSNMSQTNLAASASPVSGIQTVKAQTWVGGKTRRRNNRHNKSRKH